MHCAQVNYALKRWTRFLKSENIFILVLQEFLTNAVLELLTRMKTSFDMLLLLISLSGSNCYFFSFPYQVQIATSSHFLIRFKLLQLLISLSGSNRYYFSFPYQVQIFYRVTHTVCYWKDNRAEFTLLSFCSFKTVNLFVFLCQIIKYKIIWNVETKILHLDRYSYCRNKSFILCG